MKIGVDVGGSHIGVGIVNDDGIIIYKKEKDYELHTEDMSQIVLNMIIELIQKMIQDNNISIDKIDSIGIAIPGTVSDGIIIRAENLGIENFKIEKELKKVFDLHIYLQNDAKCAAIAEKKFGSLRGYEDSIFLIVGTGVGGAVFLDNKLLKPKRYSGFEVGHTVIDKNGEKCNCGRKGCFEVFASMRKFKEKIKNEFSLLDIDGKNIKKFMIQNEQNEKLEEIINRYIDDLAAGIINLVNVFEPQVISIGGSFAYYEEILLNRLQKIIVEKQELFNRDGEIPKLVVAELKNDAGIIGAAMQS